MAYDVKRMYHQAKGFQLAAERCLETRKDQEQMTLPIQAIVCYAFSCEVYLKLIFTYEHPQEDGASGHYLDKLFFDKISRQHREEVKTILMSEYQYSEEQIQHYVVEVARLFEEYRYIYEKDSDNRTHIGFVCQFASALEVLAEKLVWNSVLKMAGVEELP